MHKKFIVSSISIGLLGLASVTAMAGSVSVPVCSPKNNFYLDCQNTPDTCTSPVTLAVNPQVHTVSLPSGENTVFNWGGAAPFNPTGSFNTTQVQQGDVVNIDKSGNATVVPESQSLCSAPGPSPSPTPGAGAPAPLQFTSTGEGPIPEPGKPGYYSIRVDYGVNKAPYPATIQVYNVTNPGQKDLIQTDINPVPVATGSHTVHMIDVPRGASKYDFVEIGQDGKTTDNTFTKSTGNQLTKNYHVNPCLMASFNMAGYAPVYTIKNACNVTFDIDPGTRFYFPQDTNGALTKAYNTDGQKPLSNMTGITWTGETGVKQGDLIGDGSSNQKEFAYINYSKQSGIEIAPGKSFSFSFNGFSKAAPAPSASLISNVQVYDRDVNTKNIKTATVTNGSFPGGQANGDPNASLQSGNMFKRNDEYSFSFPWGKATTIPLSPLTDDAKTHFVQASDYRDPSTGQWYSPTKLFSKVVNGHATVQYKQNPSSASLVLKTKIKKAPKGSDLSTLKLSDLQIAGGIGEQQIFTESMKLQDKVSLKNLLVNRPFAITPADGTFNVYDRESVNGSSDQNPDSTDYQHQFYFCQAKSLAIQKNAIHFRTGLFSRHKTISIPYVCQNSGAAKTQVMMQLPSSYNNNVTLNFVDIDHTHTPITIIHNPSKSASFNVDLRSGDHYVVSTKPLLIDGRVYRTSIQPGTFTAGQPVSISYNEVKPTFGPFIDATNTSSSHPETADPAYYQFILKHAQQTNTTPVITAAFITASGGTTAAWNGVPFDSNVGGDAATPTYQLMQYMSQGGNLYISFGGETGISLAQAYYNSGAKPEALAAEYEKIYNAFLSKEKSGSGKILGFDFDIEGGSVGMTDVVKFHADALKIFQEKYPAAQIWLTLPVLQSGLTGGSAVVNTMVADGVNLSGVNLMTMDYGQPDSQMGQDADNALTATEKQLSQIYAANHQSMSDQVLWSMLGVTPMIGVNDSGGETFSLKDAMTVSNFAHQMGVGRIAMWSINRDNDYSFDAKSLPSSSEVQQNPFQFSWCLSDASSSQCTATPSAPSEK